MRRIVWLVGILLVLAACRAPAVDPARPPAIRYGEDICDRCGMIISDERFAAGLVVETEPGRYDQRIFDDIGGMFAYMAEEGDALPIVAAYVHDYGNKEWIRAEDARFVQAADLHSPMGFGLAAFALENDAAAQAAAWQGQVLTFAQAQQASDGMGMAHD